MKTNSPDARSVAQKSRSPGSEPTSATVIPVSRCAGVNGRIAIYTPLLNGDRAVPDVKASKWEDRQADDEHRPQKENPRDVRAPELKAVREHDERSEGQRLENSFSPSKAAEQPTLPMLGEVS
jgi:hypothetical protein